jgi:hypothetical protein
MKKSLLISFLFLFGCINATFTQLDTKYHGTYFRDDLSSSLTIYSLDESGEGCFFVDYESYKDLENYQVFSGFGNCDDSEGIKAEFFITEFNGTIQARFEDSDEESLLMYVQFPNEKDEVLYVYSGHFDDGFGEEEQTESETYFEREDGASLFLFDNNGLIGFKLSDSSACPDNTLSGIFSVEDEEMAILYLEQDGCEIRVLGTENGVQITESNCKKLHKKCSSWEGFYLYKLR